MREMDDMALLRDYQARQSETAFTTLVERHIGLVYCAALRQVRDPALTQEITLGDGKAANKSKDSPFPLVLSGERI